MDIEEQVKKMLRDTHKGLATKDELDTALAEKFAEYEAKQAAEREKYGQALATISELQEKADQLQLQVKRLLTTKFADIKAPDGTYKGLWPSLEMAKNFGLFVLADVVGNTKAAEELESLGIERRRMIEGNIVQLKDVSGTQITTGGAVIPSYFMGLLPVLFGKYGVFRADASEWPMASDSSYAAVQTDDVVVYAPGAGKKPTESSPGFKNVGLNAKKMMTLTAIDSECTEDMAIAIGEVVGRSIVRAFAKNEDKCGFLGDGTAPYFGFIGIGHALLNVDLDNIANISGIHVQTTPGNWGSIVIDDINSMTSRLSSEADDADAKYYCHRRFYFQVMIKLALALGGVNASEVIQTGYTANPRYLGRPVRNVSVMPKKVATADHFPLFLGNLPQGALLGQARGVTIDSSKEAYFTTDQIGMRGTERVAINVHGVGSTEDAATEIEPAIVGLYADIAA